MVFKYNNLLKARFQIMAEARPVTIFAIKSFYSMIGVEMYTKIHWSFFFSFFLGMRIFNVLLVFTVFVKFIIKVKKNEINPTYFTINVVMSFMLMYYKLYMYVYLHVLVIQTVSFCCSAFAALSLNPECRAKLSNKNF